jgi:hypothetical protein
MFTLIECIRTADPCTKNLSQATRAILLSVQGQRDRAPLCKFGVSFAMLSEAGVSFATQRCPCGEDVLAHGRTGNYGALLVCVEAEALDLASGCEPDAWKKLHLPAPYIMMTETFLLETGARLLQQQLPE